MKEKQRLSSELRRVKKELTVAKTKAEKLQRKLERQKKERKEQKVSEKNKQRDKKKISEKRKEHVVRYLCRDESSRMLPGKKDTVTKNKTKKQRRVLLHSLKDLHSSYSETALRHHKVSYRQFLRYCPFYVTPPKESDRNTCACYDHQNFKLIVDKLQQKGIILTNSVSELLALIACDTSRMQCMYRMCAKCCYDEVEFEGPLDDQVLTWEQWERVVTREEGKTFTKFKLAMKSGKTEDLLALLNKQLSTMTRHQFNWLHQARSMRELKETLRPDELCVHIDFSENYSCKLNTEVQAFHFAGSRKQATLHTCVVYTANGTHTYATISDCLRHDERAVWAHLEPVLRDAIARSEIPPSSLHVFSDGPVTQYRNRKNFYLLSTVPFLSGFQKISWNFSEKAHGKGAPDGVGGAVKRLADTAVQRGKSLQSPEDFYQFLKDQTSSVTYFWISEDAIERYDDKVPAVVPAVKGTMKLHQVTCEKPASIRYRDISCFCARPAICRCYNPSAVDFSDLPSTSVGLEDQRGKFALVKYEGKPFVGQILQVVGDEVQVSCMKQLNGKNVFTWPDPPDDLFYYQSDVLHMCAEPEPVNCRHSKLTVDDWKQFQSHSHKL